MNNTDLQNFKALFTEMRKTQLAQEQELDWENIKAGDEVDNILRERDQHLDFKLKGRQAIFLKKIDQALLRINEGSFGECQDCGDDIEVSRLQARPTATLCICCKEDQERQESHVLYAKKSHTHGKTFSNSNVISLNTKADASSDKVIQFNKGRISSQIR